NLNRAFELGYTSDIWFYFRRARAHRGLGNFDESIEDFDIFINGNPRNIWGFVNRGQTYTAMGNWDQAVTDITHGTNIDEPTFTSRPIIYERRATAYSNAREFLAADLDLLEAINLSQDAEEIAGFYAGIAQNALLVGDLDAALDGAEQAIATDADNADAYNVLAEVQLRLGSIDEAVEAATAGDDMLLLGRANLAAGDFDAALDAFGESDVASATLLQSLAHTMNEDTEAAATAFDTFTSELSVASASLLPTSAVDVDINSGQAHTIAFSGNAGDVVIITVNTIDTLHSDPFLALLNTDGLPIAFDDNGGYATNAALMEFTLPDDGTYTVFVGGNDFRVGAVSIAVTGNNTPSELDANTCAALVQTAYTITADACSDTDSNQMCYGNALLEIAPQSTAFTTSGDTIGIDAVETLELSGMNQQIDEWGISLMRVTAETESGSNENVDLVLFGEVDLENRGITAEAVEPVVFTVTAASNMNVRGGASTNDAIVGTLSAGQSAEATERNAAGDWLAITLADGTQGWVFAPLVTVSGDTNLLPIEGEEVEAIQSGGTQAFTFRSGANDRPCDSAPDSGVLIQTPQGVGEVSLVFNEVVIDLGSTAYLQAIPGRYLTIYVLEGRGNITSNGVTIPIPAGLAGRVQLNSAGLASGEPEGPFEFDPFTVSGIPLDLLSDEIIVAQAPTSDEVVEALGLPSNGIVTLDWAVGQVECIGFTDTVYSFELLDYGSLLRMGDIYLKRVDVNLYASGLVPGGIIGGGGGADGPFSLYEGTEYILNITSPTDLSGDAVRWSFEDVLTPDEFTDSAVVCDRVENEFALALN
ncbi:MAG: tetratricopeptide repeat protein, partial [Chloroflexota bacterium]